MLELLEMLLEGSAGGQAGACGLAKERQVQVLLAILNASEGRMPRGVMDELAMCALRLYNLVGAGVFRELLVHCLTHQHFMHNDVIAGDQKQALVTGIDEALGDEDIDRLHDLLHQLWT